MDAVEALLYVRRRRQMERIRLALINRRRLRHLRDVSDPFALTDEIFKGVYRLSKDLVRSLIEEVRPHMVEGRRSNAIPIEIKVLCALHFYGQGGYQRSTGYNRNLGLSQTSVSTVIEEVTAALNSDELLAKWIKFPLTIEERNRLIKKNYQFSHIPGVLGFVDGTHVAIKAPKGEEEKFLNRKLFFSINVMIVCDSDMFILNCLAKHCGGSHDSYIWNESGVKAEMISVWASGERCFLLGDSGYPHQPWLQTPILHAPDGSPEARYTELHVRARSVVKRAIGLLKARFRCLLRHRVLEYTPIKAGCIVNACAVLHNMCLREGLGEEDLQPELVEGDAPPEHLQVEELPQRAILEQARIVRQRIIDRLPR